MKSASTKTCALFPLLVLAGGCSQAVEPAEGTGTSAELLGSRSSSASVFTETNAVDGNELVAYARAQDGTLSLVGHFATGGRGTGAGLAAQGALARAGRWLFVVNAGSNEVSTFDVGQGQPSLVWRGPSGGTQPVSVAVRDHLVYVLNAGGTGTGNIAGFRLRDHGSLEAIPGSVLPVSGPNVTPTEVGFAPDGDTLIVTERDSNNIDAYYVDGSGMAHGPRVNASNGPKPFGFQFTPDGELLVSEAMNSGASSYFLQREVRLDSVSASIANGQKAACWLVTSPDGRYAYTGNGGSGNVSSYRVGRHGELTLAAGVAGSTGDGSHTIDVALTPSGRTLYALANVAGTVTAFDVDGANLTEVGSVGSLPASSTGLVAW